LDPKSSYICFSWRDARGSQHQQSTHTADPAEATAFKFNFLRDKKGAAQERKV
jgi:integrase